MNRREFLEGSAATAVYAAIPKWRRNRDEMGRRNGATKPLITIPFYVGAPAAATPDKNKHIYLPVVRK